MDKISCWMGTLTLPLLSTCTDYSFNVFSWFSTLLLQSQTLKKQQNKTTKQKNSLLVKGTCTVQGTFKNIDFFFFCLFKSGSNQPTQLEGKEIHSLFLTSLHFRLAHYSLHISGQWLLKKKSKRSSPILFKCSTVHLFFSASVCPKE